MQSKMISSFIITLFYLHRANSNIFIGGISSSSSNLLKCTSSCETTFPLTSNKVARSECCNRGCRFYGIAELVGARKQTELNISRDACHSCCFESYTEDNDRAACNKGCDTMAKHQRENIHFATAEVSWSFFVEDGDGTQILQGGEVLEPDDVLTDPALKRQLISDLLEDNKLPQVQVKTLPIHPNKIDKWWGDCMAKHIGIPRCLTAGLLVFLILFALVHLFISDRSSMHPISFPSDQASPLPPKYSLLDEDFKVVFEETFESFEHPTI